MKTVRQPHEHATVNPAVNPLDPPLPGPDHHCLVDDGNYRATFIGAEGFCYMRGGYRVALWFRLEDGQMIAAYYAVRSVETSGKRVRNPTFKVGWRSRLARDLITLFPDRYSPSRLPTTVPPLHEPVRIVTATVTKDAGGHPRERPLWSSKVERVAGWADR